MPIDVLLQLVDENWIAHADVMIQRLTWEQQATTIDFKVVRVYAVPFPLK